MADKTFTAGTVIDSAWLNDVNRLTYDLPSTASGKGASLVGVQDAPDYFSGTNAEALFAELGNPSGKFSGYWNILRDIPPAEWAAIFTGTSTTNLAPYFQTAINRGKPFYVPAGSYRIDATLNWATGARMFGAGCNYEGTSTPNTAGGTYLYFNADLIANGIQFQSPSGGLIQNWEINSLVMKSYGTTANRYAMKMLYMPASAGSGVAHFNIENVMIGNVAYAIWSDDGFFSGTFKRLLISTCVYGIYRGPNENSTSLSGSIWFFHVFAPLKLWNTSYSSIEVFCDHCGLNASTLSFAPTNEMPVLVYANATQALTLAYFGVEASPAVLIQATNNATIRANTSYYFTVADIFTTSSTRISNIVQAEQALFHADNSTITIAGMRTFAYTVSGYPAFDSLNPRYFAYLKNSADWTRVNLENCQIDMQSFGAHPSGQTGLVATRFSNGSLVLGNTTSVPFSPQMTYTNGVLTVGATPSGASTAHSFTAPASFVEGTTAFFVRGAPGAASVVMKAVNGVSANAANCALSVPNTVSNSRSINAAGTVNASGADYAEYERNNGLTIAKGQIVGFKSDGTLTLTYSESVRFGIKSTNPSYVGGDTWCTAVEPADDATDEEKAAFRAQLEADRAKVDRIAYSGKVPCNVGGATPGQYIIATAGPGDSIIGVPVTSPGFDEYRACVGRVNRVLDDGRAEVAVIVH